MRAVTTNDAVAVAELDALLFPENCFNETTIANELSLNQGGGWVVTQASGVVAYALFRDDGLLVDLLRLGVHPEFQGWGLGTHLLQRVVKDSQRPVVLTVLRENHKALRIYRKHAFQIVGTLNHRTWVMRLTSSGG